MIAFDPHPVVLMCSAVVIVWILVDLALPWLTRGLR